MKAQHRGAKAQLLERESRRDQRTCLGTPKGWVSVFAILNTDIRLDASVVRRACLSVLCKKVKSQAFFFFF